jgi:hypothetical protein
MTEAQIEATAKRYAAVHGEWAWLEAGLIADRHYADGEMDHFRDWVRVAKRLDDLLPWVGVSE